MGAASFWQNAATGRLQAKRHEYEESFPNDSDKETLPAREKQVRIKSLEIDEKVKKRALAQSKDYSDNPSKLASKVVMLLEALRRRMGPVEMKRGVTTKKGKNVNKSENG